MFSRDAGIPDHPGSKPTLRRDPNEPAEAIAGRIGPGARAGRAEPVCPPALAATPDLWSLLRAFRRRWLLAMSLGLLLAGAAAAAAFKLMAPKSYAFTQIRVSASRTDQAALDRTDDRNSFNLLLSSQAAVLKSRAVLGPALNDEKVKKLNLERKYGDPIAWLEEELKVEFQKDSEIIKVTVGAGDPNDARVVVNAIREAYVREIVQKADAERADAVARLDRNYTTANGSYLTKLQNLKKMADELKLPDSETARARHAEQLIHLNELKKQHGQTVLEVNKAQGRLLAHEAQEKALDTLAAADHKPEENWDHDPKIREINAEISKWEKAAKRYRDNVGPNDPSRVRAEQTLAEKRRQLASRKEELRKEQASRGKDRTRMQWQARLAQLKAELAPLMKLEKELQEQINKLNAETVQLGKATLEYEALKGEVAREEKIVNDLATRLGNARHALNAQPRINANQEAALLPLDPKKQLLATAVSGAGAFGLVCFVVAFVEFRRRRVQCLDEVATGLGIRVVGAVPASRHVEQMINPTPEEQEQGNPLLESIDALRTQLLRGESARILMVTSASAGEGKTTLAAHLAGSLARAGRRALLIDGDLRQPAAHQIFEAVLQPGFSEVLLGEVDVLDAVQPTPVDGLMLMTAGQWDREVLQSLARDGMTAMLEKLKEAFDFIIVDSHPVLATTDSLLLAQNVDAVILSVLRDVSKTPLVFAAMQRLTGLGIRVLGAVVNGLDPEEVYSHATPAVTAA